MTARSRADTTNGSTSRRNSPDSYTSFRYSDLRVTPTPDGLDASFTVRNVGNRTGAEVAQVYVGPAQSSPVPLAQRSLVGFERVTLAPGRSQRVTAHVAGRGLSYWSTATHDWALALGARALLVGASSRDIRLRENNATAPALGVPTDLKVRANRAGGAVVSYATSATGVAGVPVTVTCTPPSGSLFPVGRTTVTCVASDGSGNSTTRRFHVTVARRN
jgi:hypothetical protein